MSTLDTWMDTLHTHTHTHRKGQQLAHTHTHPHPHTHTHTHTHTERERPHANISVLARVPVGLSAWTSLWPWQRTMGSRESKCESGYIIYIYIYYIYIYIYMPTRSLNSFTMASGWTVFISCILQPTTQLSGHWVSWRVSLLGPFGLRALDGCWLGWWHSSSWFSGPLGHLTPLSPFSSPGSTHRRCLAMCSTSRRGSNGCWLQSTLC